MVVGRNNNVENTLFMISKSRTVTKWFSVYNIENVYVCECYAVTSQ